MSELLNLAADNEEIKREWLGLKDGETPDLGYADEILALIADPSSKDDLAEISARIISEPLGDTTFDVSKYARTGEVNLIDFSVSDGFTEEDAKGAISSLGIVAAHYSDLLKEENPGNRENWIARVLPDNQNVKALFNILVEKDDKENSAPINPATVRTPATIRYEGLRTASETKLDKIRDGLTDQEYHEVVGLLDELTDSKNTRINTTKGALNKLLSKGESKLEETKVKHTKEKLDTLNIRVINNEDLTPTEINEAFQDASTEQKKQIIDALISSAVKRGISLNTAYEGLNSDIEGEYIDAIRTRGGDIITKVNTAREQLAEKIFMHLENGIYRNEADALTAAAGDTVVENLLQKRVITKEVMGKVDLVKNADFKSIEDMRDSLGNDPFKKNIFDKQFGEKYYDQQLGILRNIAAAGDEIDATDIVNVTDHLNNRGASDRLPAILEQVKLMNLTNETVMVYNRGDMQALANSIIVSEEFDDLSVLGQERITSMLNLKLESHNSAEKRQKTAENIVTKEKALEKKKQANDFWMTTGVLLKKYAPAVAMTMVGGGVWAGLAGNGFWLGALGGATLGGLVSTGVELGIGTTAEEIDLKKANMEDKMEEWDEKISMAKAKSISLGVSGSKAFTEILANLLAPSYGVKPAKLMDAISNMGFGAIGGKEAALMKRVEAMAGA